MTGPELPEPPKPPEPPPDSSPGARYVAMGSSFAAGPGIGPRAPGSPRAAGRSSANYAHLVAPRLALELADVTFSGATTQDILAATAAGRPAQIDALTPATKLVTLTGGGNDVGWAPASCCPACPGPCGLSRRSAVSWIPTPTLT
jgi:lysophospholipase L1-like esterase